LWVAFRLPYERRVVFMGRAARRLGWLIGMQRRAENNLAYIYPDMPRHERRRIAGDVLDNVGRSTIENYSHAELMAAAERWAPRGPGLRACEEARAAGRPILSSPGTTAIIRYSAPP
jgi:KDO2-lipid IV(A) lauroyltransferase